MSGNAPASVEGPPLTRLEEMIWIGEIPTLGAAQAALRKAIVFADRDHRTTYEQLEHQSNACAAWLRAHGLEQGDRVAYLGPNSDLFFPVLFGAIRAGVVLVPLNWRLAPSELRYQLADSQSRVLICDPDFMQPAQRAIGALAHQPALLLTEGEGGLRAALAASAPKLPTPKRPDQVILQMYTSGTTGKPKGVLISHGAVSYARHAERISADWADWLVGETSLSAMPNFHIGGLSWALIGLIRLATVVITANATPANLLCLMRKHRVSRSFIVPVVLRALLDELKQGPAPQLRGIYYGAMPIGESLLREVISTFGCALGQFFGMTEVAGTATYLPPSEHRLNAPQRLKSVGLPIAGVRVQIRGPHGHLLAIGESGEIWVQTPTCMLGYWNLPEQTARAIIDGWYATGDGGYLDEHGYLYLTDRIKDMIVTGGENVYPVEVEEALRQHPAVLDAGVVGLPDPRWGERVVAVVELKAGAAATSEELCTHARTQIAAYKCPKMVYFEVLPRTVSGKLQRGELRRKLTSGAQEA